MYAWIYTNTFMHHCIIFCLCRYRISFRGVDTDSTEEANPTFAEFTFLFFLQQGNVQIGKDTDYLVAEARGRGDGHTVVRSATAEK